MPLLLEGKKDATTSPLRVLLRVPLQREDRFADDRAMKGWHGRHRTGCWPTTARVEASHADWADPCEEW